MTWGVLSFFASMCLGASIALVPVAIGRFRASKVSGRKQPLEALHESSELVTLLLESAPEAIYGIDLEGNCTFCNPSFLRLLGYSEPAEVLGKNAHSLFHHSRPDGTAYPLEDCPIYDAFRRETGTHADDEVLWRKDGRSVPVEYWSHPIHREGKTIGTIVSSVDITKRKQVEETLRTALEAAEGASQAKGMFLANMSHEIRTPMNGIIGMTDLTLETDLSQEQRRYLGLVKSSADSLLAVINDLLDFSKIEAGKLDLEEIGFSLRETLSEALKLLSVRAHTKGLELACDIDSGLNDVLLGDPGRLRQIIVNLVGNAIKFTESGEVVVRAIEESRLERGVEIHFMVSDTGIGIPAEKQATIFEAFAQADGSTTRKYGGTGLGLSISRRLVEMMDGRIWIESVGGKGSTFHFTARFGLGNHAINDPAIDAPVDLDGLPALVVDDNLTSRTIFGKLLQDFGMRPVLADGPWQAISEVERAYESGEPFKLILLDARLPQIDGFALCDWIRETRSLAGTSVVMLSSTGQHEDAVRCRELGMAYLLKPVDRNELRDVVCSSLAQRAQPVGSVVSSVNETKANGARALRLLLAEDNEVNQDFALTLLVKQGHSVEVANNGLEALEALEKECFDAVLMDVQMPEMDGFEATAAIRQKEKKSGAHIPIIAMTAHAMKGDREKCLLAGMDGYVSKPIKNKDLIHAIETAIAGTIPVSGTISRPSLDVPSGPADPVIDREGLLAHVGGDLELLGRMVSMFTKDVPKRVNALREAVETSDAASLKKLAHALKGAVSNFSAETATSAAFRLETIGREGDLAQAPHALEELEAALNQLMPQLTDFVSGARKN